MKKKIKSCNEKDLENFSDIIQPLVDFINLHWEGEISPKGYKEFIKDYEDYKGMPLENEEEILDSFKGFNNSSSGDFAFPIRATLPHIAYDDKCQGRNPLHMLISISVSYGMAVQQQRDKLKAEKALKKSLKSAEDWFHLEYN